jgi:uncharacterized protein involved in outer membrane biogenesis
MTRAKKRWLVSLSVFVALVATGVYLFEWNMLRGPIAKRVEHATGRTFAINGDLHVRLSRMPRITVDGLVLGNAPWAKDPTMAEIGRLDFTIDPFALWRGRVVLPELNLTAARVVLERNPDGAANWTFDNDEKKETREPPAIGALVLERSRITFRDPTIKTDFATDVSTVPADQKDAGMLKLAGRGTIKGLQGTVDGVVGSVLALSSAEQPYPIRMRAAVGSTRARVDGTLIDPLHLKGEDLNFHLEGADLAQLFPIVGVPLPPTPPYRLSGHLNHTGDTWTFRRFAGRVGNSDLAGDFAVDRGRKPQLITADLVSRNLDMKDLGGFVGADRGTAKASPKPPPPDRVLPQEPFSLEKLRVANANVKFRGERVVTEKLPLEKITATLKLNDGVLTLEPLNFGVAGGNLVSQIRMDARQQVIRTRADIAVKQLRLEKLFPGFKLSQANAGVITGRIKADTTGNSVARMLAQANGDAAVMMEGGSVSELLVRLINLDVANAIPRLLTGDRQLPTRCMVTHLQGVNGDFKVQTLVLDTGKAVVTGTGGVNFADESLDLKLVSKSKGFSLVALRGPINIKGTFKNPKVGPDIPRAATRGAAALALGWATGGLGALIPLIDLGGAQDSDCAGLMQEAGAFAPQRMHSAQR